MMNVFPIVHSNFLGKKIIFIVITSITVFYVPIWYLIQLIHLDDLTKYCELVLMSTVQSL